MKFFRLRTKVDTLSPKKIINLQGNYFLPIIDLTHMEWNQAKIIEACIKKDKKAQKALFCRYKKKKQKNRNSIN